MRKITHFVIWHLMIFNNAKHVNSTNIHRHRYMKIPIMRYNMADKVQSSKLECVENMGLNK